MSTQGKQIRYEDARIGSTVRATNEAVTVEGTVTAIFSTFFYVGSRTTVVLIHASADWDIWEVQA